MLENKDNLKIKEFQIFIKNNKNNLWECHTLKIDKFMMSLSFLSENNQNGS